MMRGFRFYLVGSAVLVALAGCGRGFFQLQEREAWRQEAEVQCLKSGAVKESPALVRVNPIEGPGICGAAFPLKVAALGESTALGFANDPRPPGSIPNAQPRWPIAPSRVAPMPEVYAPPPQPSYNAAPRYQPSAPPRPYGAALSIGEPLSLTPPGIADLIEADEIEQPSYAPLPPSYPRGRPSYSAPPSYPPDRSPAVSSPPNRPASAPVPLGPARAPRFSGPVGPVEIKPTATLACPIVSALDQWIAASVQPSAMRWFGQPVVEIKQISAYSCRGMNGQPGARISEHAFGNALDIASFTLADGRKVTVRTAWNGSPEEQGFLHDIQGAACEQFSTVLAPGSNQFHYDHIHVDLMRRSGGQQICQPAAIPGEMAAARAAQRKGYARRGDPDVTGSIGTARASSRAEERWDDHEMWAEEKRPSRRFDD